MEIKQVGEIQIAINVTNHYIKKTVKENLLIVNVMLSMNRYGHRKKLSQINNTITNFQMQSNDNIIDQRDIEISEKISFQEIVESCYCL